MLREKLGNFIKKEGKVERFMIEKIEYLLSLVKPNGERGKLIVFDRKGNYETQWTTYSVDEEETHLEYAGPELTNAWKAVERILFGKITEGYQLSSPLVSHILTALPLRFTFTRKLECFSTQHTNPTLFQELKKWRKDTSNTCNLPPYFIGTDKLLNLLSTFVPHNEEQILQIPGIGQQKYSQYGLEILEITKKYDQAFPYPLHWINEKVNLDMLAIWMITEKMSKEERKKIRLDKEQEDKLRLLEMIEDELSFGDIAQRLEISLSALLGRVRELAKEGYEVMAYLQKEVNSIQERETILDIASALGNDRLKPIYQKMYGEGNEGVSGKEVGDRYNRIRLVCTYLQLKQIAS